MINIAKIILLLLGNRTFLVKLGPLDWKNDIYGMGQHGTPWVDKIMPSIAFWNLRLTLILYNGCLTFRIKIQCPFLSTKSRYTI